MKNRLYREDTTMHDPDRSVAGIGPGAVDAGNASVNQPAESQRDETKAPATLPFQILNSIPQIASYMTELMTMHNNLNQFASSGDVPEHKKIVAQRIHKCIERINTSFADIIKHLDKLSI